MNERLKQFLTMEGLTPARFADTMGIQRSGISHLLAGRNKPSFEFIQKILTAYPSLNPEWLILGKGKPYKDNYTPSAPAQTQTAPPADNLFESLEEWDEDDSDETMISEAKQEQQYDQTKKTEPETVVYQKKHPEPSDNPKKDIIPATPSPKIERKIARIIVFYTDSTYEER